MSDPTADIRAAWLADVEATAARLAQHMSDDTPRRPLTYTQQANEDAAAALGERLAEDAAWASDRDCDWAAARMYGGRP